MGEMTKNQKKEALPHSLSYGKGTTKKGEMQIGTENIGQSPGDRQPPPSHPLQSPGSGAAQQPLPRDGDRETIKKCYIYTVARKNRCQRDTTLEEKL